MITEIIRHRQWYRKSQSFISVNRPYVRIDRQLLDRDTNTQQIIRGSSFTNNQYTAHVRPTNLTINYRFYSTLNTHFFLTHFIHMYLTSLYYTIQLLHLTNFIFETLWLSTTVTASHFLFSSLINFNHLYIYITYITLCNAMLPTSYKYQTDLGIIIIS